VVLSKLLVHSYQMVRSHMRGSLRQLDALSEAGSLVDHATVEFNGSLCLDGTLTPCGSLDEHGSFEITGSLLTFGALLFNGSLFRV
jgi:hypothetical protein